MSFCVLFMCKYVLYYCHRVTTQLQLTNISYITYSDLSYCMGVNNFICMIYFMHFCLFRLKLMFHSHQTFSFMKFLLKHFVLAGSHFEILLNEAVTYRQHSAVGCNIGKKCKTPEFILSIYSIFQQTY